MIKEKLNSNFEKFLAKYPDLEPSRAQLYELLVNCDASWLVQKIMIEDGNIHKQANDYRKELSYFIANEQEIKEVKNDGEKTLNNNDGTIVETLPFVMEDLKMGNINNGLFIARPFSMASIKFKIRVEGKTKTFNIKNRLIIDQMFTKFCEVLHESLKDPAINEKSKHKADNNIFKNFLTIDVKPVLEVIKNIYPENDFINICEPDKSSLNIIEDFCNCFGLDLESQYIIPAKNESENEVDIRGHNYNDYMSRAFLNS